MMVWIPIILAVLGAILASFSGVVSERLYTGESWTQGRSRCNSCTRVLGVGDLVPILSWLATFGKCATCRVPIPLRYPLTEIVLAALFVASYFLLGLTLELAVFLIALFLLAVIVQYDLRHTIVPFSLSVLLVIVALAFQFLWMIPLQAHALTLMVAGGIGLGFFLLHVVSKGRWMGLGDTPVALALSLLAGNQAIAGLLFSFWSGAIVGIIILVLAPRGHKMGIEVPFVPFLAFGYLLAIFTQWNPLPF